MAARRQVADGRRPGGQTSLQGTDLPPRFFGSGHPGLERYVFQTRFATGRCTRDRGHLRRFLGCPQIAASQRWGSLILAPLGARLWPIVTVRGPHPVADIGWSTEFSTVCSLGGVGNACSRPTVTVLQHAARISPSVANAAADPWNRGVDAGLR